ncbi:MAG: protein-disulfide reductase DsbD family protein [Limisphaerales bacterium]
MDRTKQFALLFILFALTTALSRAQDPQPQTTVALFLSHETARPGETVLAAVELTSAPEWHTYWRNSGDSGLPTKIEWELPAGVTAGEIQWPIPKKKELLQVAAYVYESTEYLLVPLTIATNANRGAVEIKAQLTWLECEKVCVMQNGSVTNRLTIGTESKPSASASLIEKARERLPRMAPFTVNASWTAGTNATTKNLVLEWPAQGAAPKPDFYPFEAETYKVQAAVQVENTEGKVRLKKMVTLADGVSKWPETIGGLVVNDTSAKSPAGYEVNLKPEERLTSSAPSSSIWAVLGIAFLGGLILNIMPCVLPVIALKILSFVNQSGSEPRRARNLGLIYGLGVLFSFAVLAAFVIAVQQTGGIASWGMQYQNPIFLVVMVTLVTLIALNLFGVFEITLAGKAMGSASALASKEGAAGAFFNGVLATVLGTSCTAPFLAAAIGYALGQPAIVTLLIFLMMGVGLAFPYVVLTWNPALLRLLPKPGVWMERFKVAMGFPMLATAVWLYGVAVQAHFGTRGAFWLAMFLLLVALAAWIFGTFIQRGSGKRWFASLIAVAALVFAVGFVLEKQLNWRSPVYVQNTDGGIASNSGVDWQKWSPEAVAKARTEGRPILVDFTATWCPNCQVNKISSIEIESVEKKLKEIGAVAMIGDFTRSDPLIAQELRKFQRGGVPLVLVYPANQNEAPRVLPEFLTPGIVLDALDWAGKNKTQTNLTSPGSTVAGTTKP